MAKVITKVGFSAITIALVISIGIWGVATASRINVGQDFIEALVGGFQDYADGIGEIIGIKGSKIQPDWTGSFIGGEFVNTNISW